MTWGEAAAEQHEKDQPSEHYVIANGQRYDVPKTSTCLRPDGVEPELPPLRDRKDFESRIQHVLGRQRIWTGFGEYQNRAERTTYAEEQVRKLQAQEDQLVLMRATQILDEAEARRRSVMRKFAKSTPEHVCEGWQLQESAKGGQYCGACGREF